MCLCVLGKDENRLAKETHFEKNREKEKEIKYVHTHTHSHTPMHLPADWLAHNIVERKRKAYKHTHRGRERRARWETMRGQREQKRGDGKKKTTHYRTQHFGAAKTSTANVLSVDELGSWGLVFFVR